eukprot:EG_transcript_14645
MYTPAAFSSRSSDAVPLSNAWPVISKVAILLGLALVICSAQEPSKVTVQAFTAQRVVGVATSSAATVPTLGSVHQARQPTQPMVTLYGKTSSTAANAATENQANVMRGFGWATLWFGTMTAIGVMLWNRMSSLNQGLLEEEVDGTQWDPRAGLTALSATAMALTFHLAPATAEARLPPLDTDPNRCERAFTGNTIGQANAVSDRPLDLRICDLKDKSFQGLTLSGALMVDGQFQGSSFEEAILSKVYAPGANFKGADFTSAVLDRAVLDKADLSGAKFYNTVITGTTFAGANLAGAEFEDSLIGSEDAKRLCTNPTLTGEARLMVGCRD